MQNPTTSPLLLSQISLDELESRLDSRIQSSVEKCFGQLRKGSPQEEEDKIFTFDEGCNFLGIKKPTGYAKVSKRELPFLKKGKFIYFSKKQLTEYLFSGQCKTVEQLETEANNFISRKRQLA